jgi:hypothetical protein
MKVIKEVAMKYFWISLSLLLIMTPFRLQAADWTEEITPAHHYWGEIGPHLPEGARNITGTFHTGADGFYVAVTYVIDKALTGTTDKLESEGLLVGEIGGDWIGLGDDSDETDDSYPKVEFASFVADGELVDLVAIHVWSHGYGANYSETSIMMLRLGQDDAFSASEIQDVNWYPEPKIRETRDFDFQIAPELNGIIIWAQSPVGYAGDWENPFHVIQYLYAYDNSLFNNVILVKCETTNGFYSELPNEPPFDW